MLSADDAFAGPAALAELVRGGQAKPRELVELSLRRIEQLDGRLNAFRVTLAENALAEADSLSATDGPLAGVPVAIKDDQALLGQPLTKGSRSYGPPEQSDGETVRRLRAAGAIPIGITNVPELTIWPWTATEANGVTRNPWDTSRTTGGSSGGSAAAVAAGMVPAATGSDGGGSIRIPAACCGLVGMKPTRGRVPTGQAEAPWLDLAVYGALARSVRDSALMLDVLAGTGSLFTAASASDPRRMRIAISAKIPPGLIARLSSEQRDAWERIARLLDRLGHEVSERDPRYGLASLEFTRTWTRGIYEDSLTVPDRSQLERLSRRMASLGRILVPDRSRARLLARRRGRSARILALWEQGAVLMTPGLTRTALPAEGGFRKPAPVAFNLAASFTPFTPVVNLTGQPAIAVPAGIGPDGLPLSVQLIGRPGAEETLFALAAQIEAAQPWAERRPPVS
jgi:amidase